jgi:hypothetical protein
MTQPAFDRNFGGVGAYERLTGNKPTAMSIGNSGQYHDPGYQSLHRDTRRACRVCELTSQALRPGRHSSNKGGVRRWFPRTSPEIDGLANLGEAFCSGKATMIGSVGSQGGNLTVNRTHSANCPKWAAVSQ